MGMTTGAQQVPGGLGTPLQRAYRPYEGPLGGPLGMMAWALRELQLHEQAERQGVPRRP